MQLYTVYSILQYMTYMNLYAYMTVDYDCDSGCDHDLVYDDADAGDVGMFPGP